VTTAIREGIQTTQAYTLGMDDLARLAIAAASLAAAIVMLRGGQPLGAVAAVAAGVWLRRRVLRKVQPNAR
jgi:hypothetical protein